MPNKSVILNVSELPITERHKLKLYARKSVNQFNLVTKVNATENICTFSEPEIKMIFDARNLDLGLPFKDH